MYRYGTPESSPTSSPNAPVQFRDIQDAFEAGRDQRYEDALKERSQQKVRTVRAELAQARTEDHPTAIVSFSYTTSLSDRTYEPEDLGRTFEIAMAQDPKKNEQRLVVACNLGFPATQEGITPDEPNLLYESPDVLATYTQSKKTDNIGLFLTRVSWKEYGKRIIEERAIFVPNTINEEKLTRKRKLLEDYLINNYPALAKAIESQ